MNESKFLAQNIHCVAGKNLPYRKSYLYSSNTVKSHKQKILLLFKKKMNKWVNNFVCNASEKKITLFLIININIINIIYCLQKE